MVYGLPSTPDYIVSLIEWITECSVVPSAHLSSIACPRQVGPSSGLLQVVVAVCARPGLPGPGVLSKLMKGGCAILRESLVLR